MKILNLYAGIGGNRKLWGDEHEITAVELDEATAQVYKDYFPNDTVIIADAHQFLLEHYKEFDFIWSSPPCPTHSRLNTTSYGLGRDIEYPLMSLYQEIIFLRHWFKGKWVVENVIPYYEPLIQPNYKLDRHLWWCNFQIPPKELSRGFAMDTATIKQFEELLGYDLNKYKLKNKLKNLRNCVLPETGFHILQSSLNKDSTKINDQITIFDEICKRLMEAQNENLF